MKALLRALPPTPGCITLFCWNLTFSAFQFLSSVSNSSFGPFNLFFQTNYCTVASSHLPLTVKVSVIIQNQKPWLHKTVPSQLQDMETPSILKKCVNNLQPVQWKVKHAQDIFSGLASLTIASATQADLLRCLIS